MASIDPGLSDWGRRVAERELAAGPRPILRALVWVKPNAVASLSSPAQYVCSDGGVYWVKHQTQSQLRLGCELIACRAAFRVGAGPAVAPVDVPIDLPPSGHGGPDRTGLGLGSHDVGDHFNTKPPNIIPPSFDPATLNPTSIGTVIASMTWLQIQDEQALVNAASGRIFQHDNGDAMFNGTLEGTFMVRLPHSTTIPQTLGLRRQDIEPGLAVIQALEDGDIAELVAHVPAFHGQTMLLETRARIAQWLAASRDRLEPLLAARWIP